MKLKLPVKPVVLVALDVPVVYRDAAGYGRDVTPEEICNALNSAPTRAERALLKAARALTDADRFGVRASFWAALEADQKERTKAKKRGRAK